ncbi:helix-turn-helix transcriptional regulator [Oscillatoria sp. HE19RPO]|uniref:helix-turn-helix transcriptional regulator n=1 Tax=Oscillatoria sp. HE19RPO TaxID=2954806 RepID=UPI0028115C70|nr:helix-turn-helix transcriptional regulator [Oscillatoria sp. HE19RPO]
MEENQDLLTFMKLRERVGLTQRELAQYMGVTVTTISAWENGRHEPKLTIQQMKRLMEILDCSLEDLAEAVQNANRKNPLTDS